MCPSGAPNANYFGMGSGYASGYAAPYNGAEQVTSSFTVLHGLWPVWARDARQAFFTTLTPSLSAAEVDSISHDAVPETPKVPSGSFPSLARASIEQRQENAGLAEMRSKVAQKPGDFEPKGTHKSQLVIYLHPQQDIVSRMMVDKVRSREIKAEDGSKFYLFLLSFVGLFLLYMFLVLILICFCFVLIFVVVSVVVLFRGRGK